MSIEAGLGRCNTGTGRYGLRRAAGLAALCIVGMVLGACTPNGSPPGVPGAATRSEARSQTRSAQVLARGVALVPAAPEEVGFDPRLRARLDSVITTALRDSAAPGAAVAVGRRGRLVRQQGYGRLDWAENSAPVTDSTIYDLASLTKVIAATTAAMLLENDGVLRMDRTVVSYLPEFNAPDKAPITIGMLLTHRSGMKQYHPLYREVRGREQYLQRINAHPLGWTPGTQTNYTDWNMIVLQLVVERLAGRPMDQLLQERVFGPLGMRDTGFNPPESRRPRIAPTEVQEWRGGKVWGVVHDENAWALGGVSGHAGLFSSARDLAVFAQMLLNDGELGGVRVLRRGTVARWMARQDPGSSRALGWDTPTREGSAGRFFAPRSFGHTGFTGTSIWVDPEKELFVVLLANRVNPTRDNPRMGPLRRAVADLVQQAVRDAPLRDWEANPAAPAAPSRR